MRKIIEQGNSKWILLFLFLCCKLNAQNIPINDGKKFFEWKTDVSTKPKEDPHDENQKVKPLNIQLNVTGLITLPTSNKMTVTTLSIVITPATENSGTSISLSSISGGGSLSNLDRFMINNFIEQIQNSYGKTWGIGTGGSGSYTQPDPNVGIPGTRDMYKEAEAAKCPDLDCKKGTIKVGCFCDQVPCDPPPKCNTLTETVSGCECVPKVDPCTQLTNILEINGKAANGVRAMVKDLVVKVKSGLSNDKEYGFNVTNLEIVNNQYVTKYNTTAM